MLIFAALVASVPGLRGFFVGRAAAAPISYTANATSGQFVLKNGDPTYERTIANPTATINATVDDTTGTASASSTFQPTFTPNQAGPFGLVIYIKAEILQVSPFTGTVSSTGAVDATGQQYLAVTVYRTTTGTVGQSNGQNPATDQVLANGSTCRSLLTLHVTGQYDFSSRVLTIGQDPFANPDFPADTRSTGGTAGCALATTSLNQQLAGPTNSVTLTFGGPAASAPAAPGRVVATAGNGQAELDGAAPTDYGSPITSYTITPYVGGVAQPVQIIPASGPPIVTGLANGTSYTFTAAATNANGVGPASAQSNAVLIGAPAHPGFQSATAGVGNARVQWWPPSDNGSPITSYTITPFVGGVAQAPRTFNSNANAETVTGLTSGTAYTFTIVANNAAGAGPASLPTNAVTPT